MHKIPHPTTVEFPFFKYPWNIKIDHILGYKTNLNRFKRIVIMYFIFSDDNGLKLEITKADGKSLNTWK